MSGREPPSTRSPDSQARLDRTVEMDVREHLKSGEHANSAPPTLMSLPVALPPLRALRVAIRPGTGRNLDVTRLDDEEPVPPGTQEALLVPLIPRR
jgi:hypothetical protein